MRKEVIYSLASPYREKMDVYGYKFGKGKNPHVSLVRFEEMKYSSFMSALS